MRLSLLITIYGNPYIKKLSLLFGTDILSRPNNPPLNNPVTLSLPTLFPQSLFVMVSTCKLFLQPPGVLIADLIIPNIWIGYHSRGHSCFSHTSLFSTVMWHILKSAADHFTRKLYGSAQTAGIVFHPRCGFYQETELFDLSTGCHSDCKALHRHDQTHAFLPQFMLRSPRGRWGFGLTSVLFI